jgi:serine protease Do
MVAPDHVLTNQHVISGARRVQVRWKAGKERVPAEIVGEDVVHDLALLRVKFPEGAKIATAKLTGDKEFRRGEQVAMLGFPVGSGADSGLSFIRGMVSGIPKVHPHNLVTLFNVVNVGTSGGPMCDAHGDVIGLVTARDFSGASAEGLAMAIPAQDVVRFLRGNLKDFNAAPASARKMTWDEVDRLVSPAVVRVHVVP